MLKRKTYDYLLNWKSNHKNKCLMIKGARQVGKTYLVRAFGKAEYKSFIEINFIKQKELKAIFSGDLSADVIYKKMSAQLQNISFIPGNTLIFLDEIQNCGNARTAIKFLAEDGRFDVITSGSLLGLTYAENGDTDAEVPDSVPTGYEDFITMYSLDFEEFLWAEGYGEAAVSVLKEYWDKKEKVPDSINEKYEELFREYMVVGGMPEVVENYVTYHDFNRVAELQNRIIENYRFDIAKHAKGAEKIKVQKCYEAVPKQLAKEPVVIEKTSEVDLDLMLKILLTATKQDKINDSIIYNRFELYKLEADKRKFYQLLVGTEHFASNKDAIIICGEDKQVANINSKTMNEELYHFLNKELGMYKMVYAITKDEKHKLIDMYRNTTPEQRRIKEVYIEKYQDYKKEKTTEEKLQELFGEIRVED